MIEITLKENLRNPDLLESLKQNLCAMGVKSFSACLESNRVLLTRYSSLGSSEVECTLCRYGFRCSCKELTNEPDEK